MISAKQVNNILTRSFSGGSSILSPSVTFTAVASSYLAGSTTPVVLSGTILENDAKNITWSIKDPSGANLLSDSTGSLSPSFTLVSPPTSVGTYIYTLYVTYENSDGVAQPAITTLATITVSTPAFARTTPVTPPTVNKKIKPKETSPKGCSIKRAKKQSNQ